MIEKIAAAKRRAASSMSMPMINNAMGMRSMCASIIAPGRTQAAACCTWRRQAPNVLRPKKIKIEEINIPPAQLRHKAPLFKSMSWNGKGYYPQKGDEVWLARTAVAEASAQIADNPEMATWLIWTIINRVGESGIGKSGPKYTIQGVIMVPGQFASTRSPQKMWAKTLSPDKLAPGDRKSYDTASKIASDILAGKIADPTRGATFFHTGEPPKGEFHDNLKTQSKYVEATFHPGKGHETWYFYRKPKSE